VIPRPPNPAETARGNDYLRPTLRLLSFRPMVKGALRGFATIELPIGLRVRDVPILVGRNGAWANLPAKPLLENGQQKLDANNKPAYVAVLEWADRDLSDRFSEAVVRLVREKHPKALDEENAL
jgi:hypothetical protein